jgi:hypothetical protein
MPSTSPVLHSLIFSSLILHHLLLGLRFHLPRTTSLTDVLVVSLVPGDLAGDNDAGDDVVGDERCSEVGTSERDSFAERAMDPRLLVSGSRGADVGPGV